MAYDIFISYRRKGGYETAKHLYDLLSRDGYSVSFDIDTLRNGDFDVELLKRVEECTDFVLILNQGAFDRTIDPNFDPKKDWLRQELAHALKLGKNVIPIMLSGFTEFPDNLPADVARVQKKNGPKYDQYYFDGFYNKLIDVFLETPKPIKATAQPTATKPIMGTLLIDTDLDCRIFVYDEEIGVAKVGKYRKISLPLGDSVLKFVGLESNADCEEQNLTIENEHQKLIKVRLLDKYNLRKQREEEITERKAKEIEEYIHNERYKYLLVVPDSEFEIIKENNKCGYKLKSLNEVVIPVKYDYVSDFIDGLAIIRLNNKYGFIDKTGKEIIPIKYNEVKPFYGDLALVVLNGKYGFVDKKGEEIISLKYDYNEFIYEYPVFQYKDLAKVVLNKKWGFIDKTGKEIVPLKYDHVEDFGKGGLAKVKLGDKYGYIDRKGLEVIPIKYNWTRIDPIWGCSYMAILDGESYIVDAKSDSVIVSKYYDETDDFYEGRAKVKLKNKYGFIDKDKKEVIPLKYDDADFFSEGLVWVKLDNKYGFIDDMGQEIIPLKYDNAYPFIGGKAKVKLNGEWFYIDKNGNKIE